MRRVLAADHLLALDGRGQDSHGGLDHTTTEATQAQVEGGGLLHTSLLHAALILELLPGEGQTGAGNEGELRLDLGDRGVGLDLDGQGGLGGLDENLHHPTSTDRWIMGLRDYGRGRTFRDLG